MPTAHALVSAAALMLSGAGAATPPTLPLSIPFEFPTNQVLVKVGVGDRAPGWFILDSGASACVIDRGLASRAGLKTEGEVQVSGAGQGKVPAQWASQVGYTLPGLSFTAAKSYVIDLSGQRDLLGRDIAGILGYDFFDRFVVAVDYDAHVLTLYDPETYMYQGSGAAVPFVLTKKTPRVRVTITVAGHEPVESEVLVDSGSQDALDDEALAASAQKLEVVGGVGLGQEYRVSVARAQRAQLGPFALDNPLGVAGGVPLIGNEVLRRFEVVFDYRRSRIILTPGVHFHDPFTFDASGLDLRWTPDLQGFAVHDVARPSPAVEAGITAGDVITAIDGQPSALFTIEQVQRMLTRDDRQYRLSIRRGTEALELPIRLRRRL